MPTLRHITTGHGKKRMLADVSFEVGAGGVVLLMGGNGDGRDGSPSRPQTVVSAKPPYHKRGFFNGEDITALPPFVNKNEPTNKTRLKALHILAQGIALWIRRDHQKQAESLPSLAQGIAPYALTYALEKPRMGQNHL